jgi:hypothetical protein
MQEMYGETGGNGGTKQGYRKHRRISSRQHPSPRSRSRADWAEKRAEVFVGSGSSAGGVPS